MIIIISNVLISFFLYGNTKCITVEFKNKFLMNLKRLNDPYNLKKKNINFLSICLQSCIIEKKKEPFNSIKCMKLSI